MIIIQGKVEKSLLLQSHLVKVIDKENTYDTCIIDYAQGMKHFDSKGVHYCTNGPDMTLENVIGDFEKWYKSFERFNRIVFYVNAPISMVDSFKALEEKYNKEIITTFQTDGIAKMWEYK